MTSFATMGGYYQIGIMFRRKTFMVHVSERRPV
jgi:hypothetical protein